MSMEVETRTGIGISTAIVELTVMEKQLYSDTSGNTDDYMRLQSFEMKHV